MQDLSAQIWDGFYQDSAYAAIAPYTDSMAMLARRFNKSGQGHHLLEIGCGVGQNLLFARWSMQFEVYGVDYSSTAIQIAKDRFQSHQLPYQSLEVGDVQQLNFNDHSFDAIIERAVLQLNTLDNIKKIVQELHRVLKPGGCMSCSFLSENNAFFGQGQYLGQGDFYNPNRDGMRHYFSRNDILEVFQNFQIDRLVHVERKDLMNSSIPTESFYNIELSKI